MANKARDGGWSAHLDSFCRDHLPPPELLPEFIFTQGFTYPPRLNAASRLLDESVARGWGDRVAFREDSESWTYRELLAHANRIAAVLRDELGVVPGNRVLLRAPNSLMLVACWFAVLKVGGVAVTTAPLLRRRELAEIAAKARIALALSCSSVAEECKAAFSEVPGGRIVEFNSRAGDETGQRSLESLAAGKPSTFENCQTSAEDVALIAFTSGTTGRAKGTMHTHRDLIAACDCFPRHVLQAEADDVFIGSPPLAFTFALGGLLVFPMNVGASCVLLRQTSPKLLLEGIARHRATICFTAPTAYRAMLKEGPVAAWKSLRKCVSAGEPLSASLFEKWREATGISIIDGIGSTEMFHIFISATEEESRPGSTGKQVPGYEARILRPDGREAAAGEIGRLALRGPTGCRYLDDVEQQKKYVQHGWNLTGDSFSRDADGYFWFQARTDDIIVSSGYNISGVEVEQALQEHPAVVECAVVGAPDEERGQVVKAFIVTNAQAGEALKKELQEFVKQRIAPYKYPRAVEFVTHLPRTVTGKLQRHQLKQAE